MPKYEIKPGLALTTVPGVGVVKPGDVIEGNFERYVPGKLRRVPGGTAKVAVPPPPPPPAPEPEAEAEEEEEEEVLTDEEASEQIPDFDEDVEEEEEDEEEYEAPSMDWKKSELVAYAEEMGLSSEGTKADILARIEAAEEDAE